MVVYDRINEKIVEIEANLGEEPDLSQDEAIDDMDGVTNYYHKSGFRDGLKFALSLRKITELTLVEKLNEGICVACGGDDVTCEENCTIHKCVDCNYVQENRGESN